MMKGRNLFALCILFLSFQTLIQSAKVVVGHRRRDESNDDTPLVVCSKSDGGDPFDCECYINEDRFGTVQCENGSMTSANIAAYSTSDGKDLVVKVVRLAGNSITRLEKGKIVANHTATIEILDLSDNSLVTIEDGAFEGMCHLRHLRLSANRLTTLRRSMFQGDGLQWKLTRLYLNGNRLSDIGEHVFDDLSTIELIDLDDNPNLELTSATFGRMHHLRELSLDNCGLKELPTELFAELLALEHLSLRNNPLSVVPPAVKALPTLTSLDISGTYISELTESSMAGDYKLRSLIARDLAYLWAIEDCAFCGLPHLESVVFADCPHLYLVHENAFGQVSAARNAPNELQSVDFERCNLSSLDERLYPWGDLKSVKLGDNPYRCDCDIVWMTDLAIDFSAGDETPACKTPANLLGRPVSVLRSRELCPAPPRAAFRLERLILALGLIIILAVGIWYVWSRRAGGSSLPRRCCCIGNWRNMYQKPHLPRFDYHNLVKDDEKWLGAEEFVEPTDVKPAPVEV